MKLPSRSFFLGFIAGCILVGSLLSTFGYKAVRRDARMELMAELMKFVDIVDVIVAREDIRAGDKITTNNLAITKMPIGRLPPHCIPPWKVDSILDRVLHVNLKKGSPICREHLQTSSSGRLLSEIDSDGM